MLIGFEYESYCVTPSNDCPGWRVSENYLTNTRVETNYKMQGARRVGADKQTLIPPVKVEFMDARLNERNHKGDACARFEESQEEQSCPTTRSL